MVEYYSEGYRYILEADIIKFFDTVNKERLIEDIKQSLPDSTINDLFEAALKQDIGNESDLFPEIFERYFHSTENGIPQGNSLSPLLANIYLAGFDQEIIRNNFKMIRYADDFIIMTKTVAEAERAYAIAKVELEERLQLKIHEIGKANDEKAKTKIVDPQSHKFSFLSIRFDGNRCWVSEKKFNNINAKIVGITDAKSEQNTAQFKGLLQILKSLQNTVEGWIAAYHFVDLSTQIPEIDKLINRQLYLLLTQLGYDIQKKTLERISFKGKSNEVWALSKSQRRNIGIKQCDKIWESIKSNIKKDEKN